MNFNVAHYPSGFKVDAHCAVATIAVANKFSVAVRLARKLRIFSEGLYRATRQLARLVVFFTRLFAVPLAGCDGFAPFYFVTRNQKPNMAHENEFHTFCPICNGTFWFPKEGMGQTAKCPHCNEEMALIRRDKDEPKPVKRPPTTQERLENLRFQTAYGAFRAVGVLAGALIAIIGAIAVLGALSHANLPEYARDNTTNWWMVGVSGGVTLLLGSTLMLVTPLLADIADAKLETLRLER